MMAALAVVGKFLKSVPLWVWLAIAGLVGIYFYGEHKANQVYAEWDAQKELDRQAVEKDKMFRDVSTSVVQTVYKERIKTITQKGDTIVRIQENFVPVDSGTLPAGFRVFYDAAVTNTIPDTAAIATSEAVAVADVASTTAVNFTRCNVAYEVVEGWQEWADKQCAQNPKGCPENGR